MQMCIAQNRRFILLCRDKVDILFFMNKQNVILIVIAVVIIVGLAYWYLWRQEEKPAGIGAQIFERTENPTKDKFPEANPFAADTNPFDAKTNPYQDQYKNPFKK